MKPVDRHIKSHKIPLNAVEIKKISLEMAYFHGFERLAGQSVTSAFIEDERYLMKSDKVQ
jgi:hypothetical protein